MILGKIIIATYEHGQRLISRESTKIDRYAFNGTFQYNIVSSQIERCTSKMLRMGSLTNIIRQ